MKCAKHPGTDIDPAGACPACIVDAVGYPENGVDALEYIERVRFNQGVQEMRIAVAEMLERVGRPAEAFGVMTMQAPMLKL